MDHPSAELKLPLDGDRHRFVVPRDTTLFFWGAVVPGTRERVSPRDTRNGNRQFSTLYDARDRISWSLSLEDGSTCLLSDVYRAADYKGLAWWIARDAVELPTSVVVRFTTEGEQPTVAGESIVLRTEDGAVIPWGATIESTVELVPPSSPETEFPTRCDGLWGRHEVYVPLRRTARRTD